MNSREKMKKLVKGKTVCILAPGKSLEMLEKKMPDFKDLNVIWAGMNYCDYIESSVLSKIKKRFDIISDCTNVTNPDAYEPERIKRFINFLGRGDNNMLFISNVVIDECFKRMKRKDLLEKYEDKISTIDSVFTNKNYPKEVWDKPPNSITLLFAGLIAGQVKKIILFGYDGKFAGNYSAFSTYYKPEIIKAHRIKAYGQFEDIGGLTCDSRDFQARFSKLFAMYKKIFKNPGAEIVNCSPDSVFTVFRKIEYKDVLQEVGK